MIIWRTDPAPKNGDIFWAFLYHSGVRLLRWSSAEEYAREHGGAPDDYVSQFVEINDEDEAWSPKFWAPLKVLPLPEGVTIKDFT